VSYRATQTQRSPSGKLRGVREKPVRLTAHARARLSRGTTPEEVERAIREAPWTLALEGRRKHAHHL